MSPKVLLFLSVALLVACQFTFSQNKSPEISFLDSILAKENYHVALLDFEHPKNVRTTGLVKANHNDHIVTFSTAESSLKFFESLKIDLQNATVLFRNDTIPFLDETHVPASSPFGEWHGYTWQQTKSNPDENDIIVIDNQTYKSTQVDFGKVTNNNKILLRIKYKDVEKGTAKTQFTIACYLN